MPKRFYATTHPLVPTIVDAGSEGSSSVLRIVHIDACLLVCGLPGNFRCEDAMNQNFPKGSPSQQHHLQWIAEELAKPAQFRIVVGHWPLYSFFGNGTYLLLFIAHISGISHM